MKLALVLIACLLAALPARAEDLFAGWPHSGSLTILTTPDGAYLSASASIEQFPLLVRLDKDWFDFRQAQPHGEDLRFSTSTGQPLAYEIDEWDAVKGSASIWVRVPHIAGNSRQEIRMHWGKPDAVNESSAKSVFNDSNGYLSVWHLGDVVRDEVGTLDSKDTGTTLAPGIIGKARHFAGKQGIFCGDKISAYPQGDAPHTTEAWFRAERPNTTIVGWGSEGGGRGSKVRMLFQSPPHVRVDSDFSDIKSDTKLPMGEWIHVVHTYGDGPRKIYINGKLDGVAATRLDIKNPARLWLGGWYHNYDYVGDLDEVRVSKVARSADWVRLEFENQKPLQTVVGPLVQPSDAFAVLPTEATVLEGKSATFTAQAGGAQKVLWSLVHDGRETVVAVDRFSFAFAAGRVTGDQSVTLRFKAVLAGGVKTRDIPILIKEAIADPVFTLRAPSAWDGRTPIEVMPEVSNLAELKAQGAGEVKMEWSVSPFAVLKEMIPEKLILTRAQNSGPMTVRATLNNGGLPVTQSVTINVTEPAHDAWLPRTPAKDERPEDGQFYARDESGKGMLFCNGTLDEPADAVFLKLYAGEKLVHVETANPGPDKIYALTTTLDPGLIEYHIEFGSKTDSQEKILFTAKDLVCGDAYLIDGQSNAEATSWGKEDYPFSSAWIRSYGAMDGSPKGARKKLWGHASARAEGGTLQIGYWGMELARRLVESEKMPICIINGAVGGTRIDAHQREAADPEDVTTIYGRLLWRVRQARLTHGIRGVLWHQGENDQGADGPTGGFGWETYRQFFIEMAAGWKQDYPNIRNYYLFQIWPKSCAMGINGSDNRLREVQRTLPTAFSHLGLMSTLGIEPPGGCHYPPEGYAEIARLIWPLLERDHYGKQFPAAITPPNLLRASFTGAAKDSVALEFDQPVQWDDSLTGQFYLDGEKGKVSSGVVSENLLTLKLAAPSAAKTITYLDSAQWSQKTLLRGANGIAALTFCEVPLADPQSTR